MSDAWEPRTLKAELLHPFACPRSEQPVLPQQLLRDVEQACSRPLVWLDAAAGSGKTTLAHAYANLRERPCLWLVCDERDQSPAASAEGLLQGLAALCGELPSQLPQPTQADLANPRDYWGRLFAAAAVRLPQRALLVLDDIDKPGHAPHLVALLEDGLTRLPPGCNAMALSRLPAPPAMAVLRSRGLAAALDAQALAFGPDDILALARLRGHADLAPKALEFLQQASWGWAAGLALLLDQPRVQAGLVPVEALDDYFSLEVVRRLPPDMLPWLCELARVGEITPALAQGLHPERGGGALLDGLWRNHCFVARRAGGEAYALHPMFCDFLRRHALRVLGARQLREMDRRIAAVLWAQGREDEAAAMLARQGLFSELVQRLPSVFPDWLRGEPLRRARQWMQPRPQQQGQPHPWQECWIGLGRLGQAPAEARVALQRAIMAFAEEGDGVGEVVALTGIVETVINQWGDFHALDRWIPELDRLLDAGLSLPEDVALRAQVALFMAMMYRQPGHAGLPALAAAMHRIAERCAHEPLRAYAAAQLLLYQSWWRGDMVAARLVFELAPGPDADARPVPAALIAWTVAQSVYQGLMHGEPADAMALLDNGLALGRRSEVHAWDSLLLGQSLWCCLSTGKLAEARAFARRMARSLRPGRHLDHSYYHHLSSILALHEGDHPAMRAHAQAALRCARDAGVPWAEGIVLCAVARAQALHGDASAARLSLDEAEALAARIRSDTVHFDVLLARLELGLGQTGTPDPDDTLRRWMGLWCRSGFTNFPWWRDAVVATQCAKALAHGIEPEFVRKIIRARRLQPPPDAPVPPSWQLPVEIRVLGPFGIEIDGRAIAASGKTPKKPLELLKLLVGLGGQACKTRLAEVLWPHLDDIAAQQVLRVTLHRLRNLVGHDGIVCLAGRVSIDEHRCRVDLLGMFRDLASLEQAPGQQADLLFDLLARHAAGVFPGEPEAGWAADVRHQLRARLSACLHARTQACAAAAQWEDLAACCERGLAFDAHDAAFHHGLIQACLELGRPREARDAYLRCVELVPNQADLPLATLRARLGGTPPSARPISF